MGREGAAPQVVARGRECKWPVGAAVIDVKENVLFVFAKWFLLQVKGPVSLGNIVLSLCDGLGHW